VTTRVLVVDDDPHILRAIRIHLTASGYAVSTAQTGRAALRAGAAEPPDLVLLDLGLPDLDGTAVIGELRRWSSVPIIVLSARSNSVDKINALDTGADDYVTKPFSLPELLARMRAAVRRSAHGSPANGDTVVDTPDSASISWRRE
jgi:two-component system KDP operon response regulator KdpE